MQEPIPTNPAPTAVPWTPNMAAAPAAPAHIPAAPLPAPVPAPLQTMAPAQPAYQAVPQPQAPMPHVHAPKMQAQAPQPQAPQPYVAQPVPQAAPAQHIQEYVPQAQPQPAPQHMQPQMHTHAQAQPVQNVPQQHMPQHQMQHSPAAPQMAQPHGQHAQFAQAPNLQAQGQAQFAPPPTAQHIPQGVIPPLHAPQMQASLEQLQESPKSKSFIANLLKRSPKAEVPVAVADVQAPAQSGSLFDKNFLIGALAGIVIGFVILPMILGMFSSPEPVARPQAQVSPAPTQTVVATAQEGGTFIDNAIAADAP